MQESGSAIAPDLLKEAVDSSRDSERCHALTAGVLEALTWTFE
jgi:hypothetical protein